MVKCLVIPHRAAQSIREQELDGLNDFVAVTSGWLDPIELNDIGVTLFTNQEPPKRHGLFNVRATTLCWFFSEHERTIGRLISGNVILTGADNDTTGADVPETIVNTLTAPLGFVIQGSPNDDDTWYDTRASFDNIFDACTWSLLFAHRMPDGPAFRIHCTEPAEQTTRRGTSTEEQPW